MKPIEWTEAHRREALRRTCELAAVAVDVWVALNVVPGDLTTSNRWAEHLSFRLGFDADRVAREVRRVDRLARGLLVRESGWAGRTWKGTVYAMPDRDGARAWVLAMPLAMGQHDGRHVVRVTRIVTRIRRAGK